MTCKYCFAELEDGTTVCPLCGKELEETTQEEILEEEEELLEEEILVKEKKNPFAWMKSQVFKKTISIIGVTVLALLLAGAILNFMGYGKTLWHNMQFWRDNDINYRLSYTVKNSKAEAKKDEVVATLGNQKLTNGELQAHYWSAVFEFVNYYGEYISYSGLDITKPLSEQYYGDTGKTYQQWFLELALDTWSQYALLAQMAEDAGFQLDAEQQKTLASFESEFASVMAEYKYTDPEKFIDEQFFPGCSYELYLKYNKMNYLASTYYYDLYSSIDPTMEDLEAYYTAHEAEFIENKIDKESGNYYDVRHVLLGCDGSADADGNYGEDQWAACLEAAQEMLDSFLANEPTEEKFAEMAINHSQDPGSKENGGLYTDLTENYGFIKDFENWYLDETRGSGDTGLVQSDYGYHSMYFSTSSDIWKYEAENMLLSDRVNEKLDAGREEFTMTVDFKKIVLGYVDLSAT